MKRAAFVSVATFLAAVCGFALVDQAVACFVRSPQPVQVWLDHVNVEITDQVAVKTYNCTFRNPNPRAVVGGECYMELEPGARVSNMSVVVDGKESRAEILDVKKANEVFTQIVQESGSPALLEYYGNQLIRTKIPRIAPNGTVTVKLRYTMILAKKADLVRLQMLNTNPKANMQTLQSASVRVAIKSSEPIKNVYSPSHPIDIVEEPDWDLVIKWSQENYTPTHPFVLYYQLAEEKIGATLLAHREPGEQGHFMLLLSPTVGGGDGAMTDDDVLPKDIVFCIDTSGSMIKGDKMDQARAALVHCINQLRPGDRFNIVDFGTGVRSLQDEGLIELDEDSRKRALGYAKNLYPGGGTAMDEALATSLAHFENNDRLKMILFATDGLPTVGERSGDAILKGVAKRNEKDVRLFVFGQGHDVDTRLLDLLAAKHRGEAEYVLPKEDISQKITRFFHRVGAPLMTDVQLFFEGIETRDVLPRRVPDLYRGEQLIVFGRYEGGGPKTVRVRGRVGGDYRSFVYQLDFPAQATDDRNAFVPRLWAGEMVDFLLDEIRTNGEDDELIKEVTRLAKRYGIVTPYTSFLMVEETCNAPLARQMKAFKGRLRADGNLLGKAYGGPAVNNAWQQSRNKANRKQSGNAAALYTQVADALDQEGRGAGQGQTQGLAAMRYVGNRTFYNAGGRWYDSRFDETQASKVQNVTVGSTEYINLLNSSPSLAKYMSQGDVVVEHQGNWYRFQPKG